MATILLNKADCQHIAYCFNERRLSSVPDAEYDIEGTRLMFIQAAVNGDGPFLFNLNRTQLLALDTLLTDGDPRGGKLPDGRPLTELLYVIWHGLVDTEGNDADENRDADRITDQRDGSTAVRSGDDSGA